MPQVSDLGVESVRSARPELVQWWAELIAARMRPIELDPALTLAEAEQSVDWLVERSTILQIEPDSGSASLSSWRVWTATQGDGVRIVRVWADGVEPVESVAETVAEAVTEAVIEAVIGANPSARAIHLVSTPADPGLSGLGALPGFVTRATTMHLPVEAAPPPTRLSISTMTQAEFDEFAARDTEDFADDLRRAGMQVDDARAEAERQFANSLPQGLQTPTSHLLTARCEGEPVGMVWVSERPQIGYVLQVRVEPGHRGRGFGRDLMVEAIRIVAASGLPGIGLNVFADNPIARALYDSLGFQVTTNTMTMDLTPADSGEPR